MSSLTRAAPVAVAALIAFLAYGSQVLFRFTEPGRLERDQEIRFNLLVGGLWICYLRACLVNPGYVKPRLGRPEHDDGYNEAQKQLRGRWCRKCNAPKPPRAHHCKTCQR